LSVTSLAPLYVAGHRGLVGSALVRAAEAQGLPVVGASHVELELMSAADVDAFVASVAPAAMVLASGRVGGIGANTDFPLTFCGRTCWCR